MWSFLLLCVAFSVANAEPVRPAVTNQADAKAVHILFGESGETVSTCLSGTGGWSCSPVDVDNPVRVHLLVDTKVSDLGAVSIEGPDMTIERGADGPTVQWANSVEPLEGRGDSVVVVRVSGAASDQAPMLRLSSGAIKTEAGCADDGQFPDGKPNDGLFHCASVLRTRSLQTDTWPLEVSMRTADGEEDTMGTFTFSGSTGLRVAAVTVGDPSAASSEFFPLVGPLVQPDDDGQNPVAQEVPMAAPPQAAPPPTTQPPDQLQIHAPDSAPWYVWVLVLLSLSVGWVLGSRQPRGSRRLDQAVPLPVHPIDERGPVPEGAGILVSSASPEQTLLHVAREITSLRRVVILGEVDCSHLAPIQSILRVTDPDRFAVHSLLQELASDGGLPPVLLILGADAVMDTGGASPSPALDLLEAIGQSAWCALFVSEEADLLAGLERWGHDPQAGWSKL